MQFIPFSLISEPGNLEFAKPSLVVKGSYYVARIPVNRVGGCDGHVSVKWKTTDISAVQGRDYEGGEGLLEFDNQETSKVIEIPIKDNEVSNVITFTLF